MDLNRQYGFMQFNRAQTRQKTTYIRAYVPCLQYKYVNRNRLVVTSG